MFGQIGEYLRFQHEETAVDPAAVAQQFFVEAGHTRVILDTQETEAASRLHGGDGRDFSMLLMIGDQFLKVDIGQPVPVCEDEIFVADVMLCAFETTGRSACSAPCPQA